MKISATDGAEDTSYMADGAFVSSGKPLQSHAVANRGTAAALAVEQQEEEQQQEEQQEEEQQQEEQRHSSINMADESINRNCIQLKKLSRKKRSNVHRKLGFFNKPSGILRGSMAEAHSRHRSRICEIWFFDRTHSRHRSRWSSIFVIRASCSSKLYVEYVLRL